MSFDETLLNPDEKIIFSLRELYRAAGYSQYRMGKFEEYDLYARNKDFLISDNILTFTDTGGKLMALKPDVTLSIVRAWREGGGVRKLYYNENVYRPATHSGPFRELTQSGVECIGDLGGAEIGEVLRLALQSLERIAPEHVLSVSHLGILSSLLDALGVPAEKRGAVAALVARKNAHELAPVCGAEAAAVLGELIAAHGESAEVLPRLRSLPCDKSAVDELERLTGAAGGKAIALDFSIVGNLNYYNGVVFKGYVRGIPAAVLSGGQYDALLRRMGKAARAVGFAVFVDLPAQFSARGTGEV